MRHPLSFAQEWALSRPAHLARATWLAGPVDPVALQRAVDVVVERHSALRTAVLPGGLDQVVSDEGRLLVDHVALPGGPGDAERAESIAAELAARPFDLARAPLLRVALVRVGADRWLFALVAHRVIADEAALAILLADLSTVYRDGALTAPRPWMDYADYALWQRERLRGEELERQLGHWRELSRAVPKPLALPSGHPGARVAAVLDPASTRRLAELAEGVGVTPAAVFLAGYAVVLARWARQDDVVIGVPVGGRIRAELEPIAGPFADAVPVRVSLAGGPTFGGLLGRVQDAVAHATSHDEVPFRKLAEELGIDLRDVVRFAPEPFAAPHLDLPGVEVGAEVVLPWDADVDLELRVAGGALTLGHRTDPAFADWLLRSVVSVLEHAAAGTPVADLPVLPESGGWTAVETAPPDATAAVSTPPSGTAPDASAAPSRAEVEQAMARMWAELLRTLDPPGVHDNLFGLGAGSLTAVRFASRVADTYGVDLPLPRIFTSPTIAALAEVVSTELGSAHAARLAGADREAGLADLSDDELDDLLRAVVATRDRRRTAGGDGR